MFKKEDPNHRGSGLQSLRNLSSYKFILQLRANKVNVPEGRPLSKAPFYTVPTNWDRCGPGGIRTRTL